MRGAHAQDFEQGLFDPGALNFDDLASLYQPAPGIRRVNTLGRAAAPESSGSSEASTASESPLRQNR